MSIAFLPKSTVRLLGSCQALTTPDSFVKELIDNALDARATAIFVEISSNTVDVIQVKDNGHGVAPEDRDLISKRYCTSKIKDQNDLQTIGGQSLGFRGEALASAVELSDALIMTTRIDGESIAVKMRMRGHGDAPGREKCSHPVGTTVRITGIYKNVPVRKQTAVKTASKCLAKIKHLLQAYAMARPAVRFSLKVLKAKNDTCNWMYAPRCGSGIEDAAFKIVGKDCASQCRSAFVKHEGLELYAFLPRLDADTAKISGTSHFISIDSRPVATSRGVLKDVVRLFNEKIKASLSACADGRDPFLWLNLVCPPGSYDVNVEPAKDDVLFEEPEKVLQAVKILLENCYPIKSPTSSGTSGCSNVSVQIYEDTARSQKPPAKRRRVQQSSMTDDAVDNSPPLTANDNVDEQSSSDIDIEEGDSAATLSDVNVTNPWTMAKLNSTISPRRTRLGPTIQPSSPLQEISKSVNNISSNQSRTRMPPHPPWTMLPTPENTSPIRGREMRPSRSPSVIETEATRSEASPAINKDADCTTGWRAQNGNNNDFISARALPLSSQQPHRHLQGSSIACSNTTLGRPVQQQEHDLECHDSLPERREHIERIRSLIQPPQRNQTRLQAYNPEVGWPNSVKDPLVQQSAGCELRRNGGGGRKLHRATRLSADGDIRSSFGYPYTTRSERETRSKRSLLHKIDAGEEDNLQSVSAESTNMTSAPGSHHITLKDFCDPETVWARSNHPDYDEDGEDPDFPLSLLQGISKTLAISMSSIANGVSLLSNIHPDSPHIHSNTQSPILQDPDHHMTRTGDGPRPSSIFMPPPGRDEIDSWRMRIEKLLQKCQ